jgi:hypothetical protein
MSLRGRPTVAIFHRLESHERTLPERTIVVQDEKSRPVKVRGPAMLAVLLRLTCEGGILFRHLGTGSATIARHNRDWSKGRASRMASGGLVLLVVRDGALVRIAVDGASAEDE